MEEYELKIRWLMNKEDDTWVCRVSGVGVDVDSWVDVYRESYPSHLYGTQELWSFVGKNSAKHVCLLRNIDPVIGSSRDDNFDWQERAERNKWACFPRYLITENAEAGEAE